MQKWRDWEKWLCDCVLGYKADWDQQGQTAFWRGSRSSSDCGGIGYRRQRQCQKRLRLEGVFWSICEVWSARP